MQYNNFPLKSVSEVVQLFTETLRHRDNFFSFYCEAESNYFTICCVIIKIIRGNEVEQYDLESIFYECLKNERSSIDRMETNILNGIYNSFIFVFALLLRLKGLWDLLGMFVHDKQCFENRTLRDIFPQSCVSKLVYDLSSLVYK